MTGEVHKKDRISTGRTSSNKRGGPMPNPIGETATERLFTWEEVSWMTGLSIAELLELFGEDAHKDVAYEMLPPAITQRTLEDLAESEAALMRSLVQ